VDEIDMKEMIFDLNVVLNKLAGAKKDAQRHMQGEDDPDNLRARVDRLEDTLADVSYEICSSRDDLYKIVDMLEDKIYKSLMDDLSQKVTAK